MLRGCAGPVLDLPIQVLLARGVKSKATEDSGPKIGLVNPSRLMSLQATHGGNQAQSRWLALAQGLLSHYIGRGLIPVA